VAFTVLSSALGDISAAVDASTLRVLTRAGRRRVATAEYVAYLSGAPQPLEDEVQVWDGSTRIFRGKVRSRSRTDTGPGPARRKVLRVTCQDLTPELSADVIDGTYTVAAGTSDQAAIQALVAAYGTHGVTAPSTTVSVVRPSLPGMTFSAISLLDAIDQIADLAGATYWVDDQYRLVYRAASSGALAPFSLVDTSPNGTTRVAYASLSYPEETVEVRNAVWAVGGEGTTPTWRPPVSSWPTSSQATYGRREYVLQLPDVTSQTTLESLADAYLAQHENPTTPVEVTFYAPGLAAGMTVKIESALWGITTTLPVLEVEAQVVPGSNSQFVYTARLGSLPADLPSVIGGLAEQVAAIPQVIAEVTAPDTTPPGPPTNLALSSSRVQLVDGSFVVRLTASLTHPVGAGDLWASVVEITGEAPNENPDWTSPLRVVIGPEATSGSIEGVRGSWTYYARAFSQDLSGNRSTYTATVAHTTVADLQAPPIPQNLEAVGGFRGLAARWDAVEAVDLAYYELEVARTGWSERYRLRTTVAWIGDLEPDVPHTVRVRAVDRGGLVRTSATDPTAVLAVDNPGAGWTATVSATPTLIGQSDIAANSVVSAHISTAGLDADVIKSGYLRVSTVDAGRPDGIEVWASGKRVALWDETGLYVGRNGVHLPDDRSSSDYVRITDAGLTVYRAGQAQTALTPDGINASAISFGTLAGGHNVIRNSSFELTSFGTVPSTATWDVQADWNASRVGTDTNVTTGTGSLTMTGTSY
jgi:hypothetical protein